MYMYLEKLNASDKFFVSSTQNSNDSTRNSNDSTRNSNDSTRDSILKDFEFWGSRIESSRSSFEWLSTYIWPVLYMGVPPPPPPPPRVNGRHVAVALTLLSFWFKVFYISYMICFLSVLIQESWSKDDKLQWWFEAGYQAYNAWLEGCPGCIYGIYKWFYLHYNVAAQELSNHNAF